MQGRGRGYWNLRSCYEQFLNFYSTKLVHITAINHFFQISVVICIKTPSQSNLKLSRNLILAINAEQALQKHRPRSRISGESHYQQATIIYAKPLTFQKSEIITRLGISCVPLPCISAYENRGQPMKRLEFRGPWPFLSPAPYANATRSLAFEAVTSAGTLLISSSCAIGIRVSCRSGVEVFAVRIFCRAFYRVLEDSTNTGSSYEI